MSFWRNRPLIITIILVIVLTVMLFMTSSAGGSGANSIIGQAIVPLQQGLYSTTESISSWFTNIFAKGDLEKENASLKEQVADLKSELGDYEEIKAENDRYKKLLNVKDLTGDLKTVTAKVIGKSPSVWVSTFTINVGKNDGILVNMPVITNDGLVGRIVEVAPTYSKVMTIQDSSSGIPALVERTRDTGVVTANVSGVGDTQETLNLSYLPDGADVVPGDKIITSGLGGLYPKGLPIGEVSAVSKSGENTESAVKVLSSVDFNHVEEVVVIKEVFKAVD